MSQCRLTGKEFKSSIKKGGGEKEEALTHNLKTVTWQGEKRTGRNSPNKIGSSTNSMDVARKLPYPKHLCEIAICPQERINSFIEFPKSPDFLWIFTKKSIPMKYHITTVYIFRPVSVGSDLQVERPHHGPGALVQGAQWAAAGREVPPCAGEDLPGAEVVEYAALWLIKNRDVQPMGAFNSFGTVGSFNLWLIVDLCWNLISPLIVDLLIEHVQITYWII